MNDRLLHWEQLDKNGAIELQAFTCTEDWPRPPGGRKLPKHRREWEWAAQRHFRTISLRLLGDETLLVDRDDEQSIGAATHLSYEASEDLVAATIEAGAVSTHYRNLRDRYVGDEVMSVADEAAITTSITLGASTLVLQGFIHEKNWASLRMADRAGLEPHGVPTPNGYQLWARSFSLPVVGGRIS